MLKKQWHVGILLFEDADVLDYAGPFEVFALTVYEEKEIAPLLTKGLAIEEKPFIVKTFSESGNLVTTHNGLKVQPDFSFETIDKNFDILLVPGGPLHAIKKAIGNSDLIKWISDFYKADGMVASVCSGALLLAEAGLLTGKKATTHTFAQEYMKSVYADVEVVSNVRFVDQGKVITSAGVSAGIDMALHIVGKLMGEEAAIRTAATEEYPYDWKTQLGV